MDLGSQFVHCMKFTMVKGMNHKVSKSLDMLVSSLPY